MKSPFLDEHGKWRCIRCGACCRFNSIHLPEWDLGDGTCIHLELLPEGVFSCRIYKDRPAICRSIPEEDDLVKEAQCSLVVTIYQTGGGILDAEPGDRRNQGNWQSYVSTPPQERP